MSSRRGPTPASAKKAPSAGSWTAAIDRLLALLDGDREGTQLPKLKAFETILMLIAVVEPWSRSLRSPGAQAGGYVGPILMTMLALLWFIGGWRRPALLGIGLVQTALIYVEFPDRGNHAYLEAYFFLLGSSIDLDDAAERQLYLRAVRWTVCVIFFYAGVQKCIQGFYFHGQYLAYQLSQKSFRPILQPFLAVEEYDRLAAFKGKLGDGPYLVNGPLFLVVSNTVWIAEIVLAPLFVFARTRTLAVFAAMALVVAIEAGAREVFFGFVYMNALMLLLPGDANRRLVVPFGVLLAVMMLIRLGVLPNVTFY